MGLDFAIDELYATGWTALDSTGCERHSDGRWFPSEQRAVSEFREAKFTLTVRKIELFDCYRAEWRDEGGAPAGAVVGRTRQEATVYALSHLRRRLAELASV